MRHKISLFLVLTLMSSFLPEKTAAKIRPPRPKPKGAVIDMKAVDFLFTATSPKIIHPHSTYTVILSLERSIGPVDFEIKVTSTPTQNPNAFQEWPVKVSSTIKPTGVQTLAKAQATLQPETSAVVELNILDAIMMDEVYNITVVATCKGGNGQKASDFGLAYLEKKTHSIIIQTDKPIYKPGETVQFRVLFLDRFLKPVAIDLESKKVAIHMNDAQRNIVKSWTGKEIQFQKKFGFVKGFLLLSKEPNLGSWTIEVVSSGGSSTGSPDDGGIEDERQTHSFSVEQYVLPKFKVEVKAIPSFVTYNQSTFNVEVKSTYTHGKGVQGPCTVLIKPLYEPYYQVWGGGDASQQEDAKNKPHSVTRTKELEGVGMIEYDLKNDLKVKEIDATDYGMEYTIFASCTETVSGKVQNATTNIRMYKYPWKISTVNQPSSFKPGFPLIMVVKVSKHDDTPVSDEDPEALKIRHGFSYNVEEGVMFKPIPPTGLVILTFTPPTNDMINVNGVEATYRGMTQRLGVPGRQMSPTNSYMMLTLLNNKDTVEKSPLLVGDTASILVRVNKPFDSLNWILMARGVIVKWERVTLADPLQEQTLKIALDASTVPHAQILVYTILPDSDDVVADSIKIDVKGADEKALKVTVKDYSQLNKTVEPGTNVTISFENVVAGGLLAVRGVDQSVLLLKEDKDIDSSTIKDVEQQFEQGLSSTRNWGGSDTFQVFENIGVNIMTNALITKNEYVIHRQRYAYRGGGMGGIRRGFAKMAMAPMAMPMMAMADDAPMGRSFMKVGAGGGGGSGLNGGGAGGGEPAIRVRNAFPETWIFTELGEEQDKKELLQMVPDSITSWIISAFQISPIEGLGVAKSSSKLTVFRPFFITLNVPYSVIQGEIFSLKVLIHNYLGHLVGAKVTLENPDKSFSGEESSFMKILEVIESPSVGVVTFLINPAKIGDLTLSLKAVASTNEAGDGLTQPLIVKPPGVKQSKSDAVFVNLLKHKDVVVKKSLSAVFPEHRVPGGDTIKFTVIGDLIGGALNNLESLIQLPHGCGEQNMINFVPDLVVLDYFKSVSHLNPSVKRKAVQFLETGYQRELTFKRYDGSFSAFGNSDADGSTWLTAFVVRSFIGAKRYISIDDSVLLPALDFLIRQQSDNGSFIENGYIHDQILQGGGGGSPFALTAFTLLTFVDAKGVPSLQDKANPKDYGAIVDSGIKWLIKSEDQIKDTYAIIVVSYLLHVLQHPKKESFFKLMEERALTDIKGGMKYWETKRKDAHHHAENIYHEYWHHDTVKPASVEMTAYALMTYILREGEELKDSLAIGRWLLKQRNENGGFISTQDTVVGLTSLAELAKATTTPDYKMKVKLSFQGQGGKFQGTTFDIGKADTATLQEYFLPPGVTSVDIEAEGVGTALAQLSWSYYTLRTGNSTAFALDVKVEPKDKNRLLHFTICTSYTQGGASNMAILEVNTPTGYSFEQEEVMNLKSDPAIKRTEMEDSDSRLNIYFNSLTSQNKCVTVLAHRIHMVAKHSKSSVTVYDYYDTTRKVTKLYDGPEINVCQICALDDSCKVHKCI